jgi:hypothetical protein
MVNETGLPYVYAGNDPVNLDDALGLMPVGDGSCQACEELAAQIQNLTAELSQRQQELFENQLSLPPTGPMSIAGHQQQFENKQTQLRGLLGDWESRNCGEGLSLPSYAWKWATTPVPSPRPAFVPSNSGFHLTRNEAVVGGTVVGLVVIGLATGGIGDLFALAF